MSNLKGSRIDIAKLNIALYGSADPDYPDTSKIDLRKMYAKAFPKIKGAGRLIITGTGGGI